MNWVHHFNQASLLALRVIWTQTTKANATVSVSTVSGFWRIGTVIWRTPHISHKQMKAWRFKVRLISLSELQPEYSEYWERCSPPAGPSRRLFPPSFRQTGGKKIAPVDPPCSSIFTHSLWAVAAQIWPGAAEWMTWGSALLLQGFLRLRFRVKTEQYTIFMNYTFHAVTENFSICLASS